MIIVMKQTLPLICATDEDFEKLLERFDMVSNNGLQYLREKKRA